MLWSQLRMVAGYSGSVQLVLKSVFTIEKIQFILCGLLKPATELKASLQF